ncbi:hypothetical protein HK414_15245 [Ramlibacter terrae]|uniref:Uncharacterized protein n=1 Tax=Ramlibacter terrae TaxID=2732511 RepID=A0ABX6P360_9BURK|nr:hypothetical protein HK414_15245 [Ramlibacter terrae]
MRQHGPSHPEQEIRPCCPDSSRSPSRPAGQEGWDHYRDGRKRSQLNDITEVVARPEAAEPARRNPKKASSGRKSGGPGA